MNIGERVTFPIDSVKYWNDVQLHVEKGQKYQFDAEGCWTDWYISSSDDGYSKIFLLPMAFMKRSVKDKWFALMGSINKRKIFLIGGHATITIQESGDLSFFANDVKWFYWNNKGTISLIITRIS